MSDMVIVAIVAALPGLLATLVSWRNGRKADVIVKAVNGAASATKEELRAANDLIAELRKTVEANALRPGVIGATGATGQIGATGATGAAGIHGHDAAPDLLERLVVLEGVVKLRGAKVSELEKLVRASNARKVKR